MLTEELARFVTGLTYDQLPAPVVDASKLAILDCLGVALAGSDEPASRIVSQYAKDRGGKPEAWVIGSGFKTSTEQAAWINGTKAHALDYDDYFVPGHPTVAILPAVLAVGDRLRASGKDMILAYVTGFEARAAVSAVCGMDHFEKGWHVTATLGSIGATAGVSRLLGLNEQQTRTALGIACSLTGGLMKNFGTMTKPLHAGNAARSGVIAAGLAQRGFTADLNILEGDIGYCRVLGTSSEHEAKTRHGRGPEFKLVHPGLSFKLYPSCAGTHWGIDAALAMREEDSVTARDIVDVECRTSSAMPRVLIHSRPQTGLEGKFSLEYCVAAAFCDGEVSLRQFTDERVRDPQLQQLLRKVRYCHPEEMGSRIDNLSGELVVTLVDGRVCSRRVDVAKGNPGNPIDRNDLVKKFRDCAGLCMAKEDVEKTLSLIGNLESVGDINELDEVLAGRNRSRRRGVTSR